MFYIQDKISSYSNRHNNLTTTHLTFIFKTKKRTIFALKIKGAYGRGIIRRKKACTPPQATDVEGCGNRPAARRREKGAYAPPKAQMSAFKPSFNSIQTLFTDRFDTFAAEK